MAALTVLITWTQVDVLASVIAEALRNTPDISVLTGSAVRLDEAEALLVGDSRPDVLIMVGAAIPDAIQLLERHPSLVISRIAIGPDAVHFELRKLGKEQLIGILRTLAAGDSTGDRLHVYEVHPRGDGRGAGSLQPVEVPPAAPSVLALATAWVSAALLHFNRMRPNKGSEVPGLPLHREAVHSLLAPTTRALVSEGYDTNRALNDAAIALTAGLAHPQASSQPLCELYHACDLSLLELHAFLLALAPELDVRYQQAFGSFNDDMARRNPTMALLCGILGTASNAEQASTNPSEVRQSLCALGQLVTWRLISDASGQLPPGDEPVRPDPFVASWLQGAAEALAEDPRVARITRHLPWPGAQWQRRPADQSLTQRLAQLLGRHTGRSQLIALAGDTDGWRALVEAAAQSATLPLLRISSNALAGAGDDLRETALRVARVAQLTHAIAVVDAGDAAAVEASEPADGVQHPHLRALFDRLAYTRRTSVAIAPSLSSVIGALPREHVHLLEREEPDAASRGTVIDAAAADAGVELVPPTAERLATRFPLSLAAIDDAVRLAAAEGLAQKSGQARVGALMDAFRRVAAPRLPRFAERLVPRFRLEDVVLPRDRRAQLDQIVSHVTHARTVLDAWGFGALLTGARGVAALFVGPSGTGKTMAAQGIARALASELYRVDLARVVSKFIGETEKNLGAIFDDAERAGAVLLFDEADALFGKRSEVKDAHDRYANIEVAYLLQRMETFTGVAVLTTNFRQNIDQAFLRRLRFVVEFPRPDAEARAAIWRKCLPRSAPVDRKVDFAYLAQRLEITGGTIRQITLRAAFLAAAEAEGPPISMRHLVEAARAEMVKLGMPAAERELAEYADSLDMPAQRVA